MYFFFVYLIAAIAWILNEFTFYYLVYDNACISWVISFVKRLTIKILYIIVFLILLPLVEHKLMYNQLTEKFERFFLKNYGKLHSIFKTKMIILILLHNYWNFWTVYSFWFLLNYICTSIIKNMFYCSLCVHTVSEKILFCL